MTLVNKETLLTMDYPEGLNQLKLEGMGLSDENVSELISSKLLNLDHMYSLSLQRNNITRFPCIDKLSETLTNLYLDNNPLSGVE